MAYPLPSTIFNDDGEERIEQRAPSVQGEPGRTLAGRDPSNRIQGSEPSTPGPAAVHRARFRHHSRFPDLADLSTESRVSRRTVPSPFPPLPLPVSPTPSCCLAGVRCVRARAGDPVRNHGILCSRGKFYSKTKTKQKTEKELNFGEFYTNNYSSEKCIWYIKMLTIIIPIY